VAVTLIIDFQNSFTAGKSVKFPAENGVNGALKGALLVVKGRIVWLKGVMEE